VQQKTKIPLWAKTKITANERQFGPTFIVSHLTPLKRPSFASLPWKLRDDATCTIRRRSSTSFEAKLKNPNPTYFTIKQAAGCRHVFSHRFHPFIDFEAQTDKPPPTRFWGINQEILAAILRHKSSNCRPWFWSPNQETVAVVLRQNHWQTIAKSGNPCFSSPLRVWCKTHTVSPDLPIVWLPCTRLVTGHLRSSAPSFLLLPQSSSLPAMSHSPPTHHETGKHVSRHRITQSRLVQPKCTESKFKLNQINYSSYK
jgi:hypothetical protein